MTGQKIDRIIDTAISEDLGLGDITTEALVPPGLKGRGIFLVKAPGVLAGIEVAARVFQRVDPTISTEVLIPDGSLIKPGMVVARVAGPMGAMLMAERTALNFLQRLSGIATITAHYIEAVAGLPVTILDTRKTAPGLRLLDKYAVRVGGGKNHRIHLGDGILLKDNHWQALQATGISLTEAIHRVRARAHPGLRVEVEVKNLEEARQAVEAGADMLLLDNMKPEDMRQVVAEIGDRVQTEASGGITLETVRAVAEAGVDFISVGALTHSVRALDISLEVEPV